MEDENTVPSAEASAPEPLTIDSALDRLNAADEPADTPAPVEASAEAPETEEAEPAEPSEPEADATPEAEDDADEPYAHGNARTRLRDGTVTTVGELKKAAEKAKEYEAKLQEYDARQREVEQKQQAISQQEQFFQQSIQQAKAVLQRQFPPKPDASLRESDPIEFFLQKDRYEAAVLEYRRLEHAEQVSKQQAEAKAKEAQQEQARIEFDKLVEAVPEFKSRDTLKAFNDEAAVTAKEAYGATDEDLAGINRAWIIRMAKDAVAYRKLQAEKAKVAEKVKDVPPVQVQTPGRRPSQTERQAQARKEGFDAVRRSGSFDDALRIMNALDL